MSAFTGRWVAPAAAGRAGRGTNRMNIYTGGRPQGAAYLLTQDEK
ncbi:MAG: hypothetical protein ACLUNX_08810 [Angelakisella sp.]